MAWSPFAVVCGALLVGIAFPGCKDTAATERRVRAAVLPPVGQEGSAVSPSRGARFAAGPRADSSGVQDPETFRAELIGEGDDLQASPFHRFDVNLVRNPDGTLTKFYYLRTGQPGKEMIEWILTRSIPSFAALRKDHDWWIEEKYLSDPRKPNPSQYRNNDVVHGLPYGSSITSDLLIVTAPQQTLQDIDKVLERLLADVPQVSVEATIIEMDMDDSLATGVQMLIARGSEEDRQDNLLDFVAVDLANSLGEGTIGTFSTVQDETVINAMLDLLQKTRNTEVLSAPKLAVLHGHRAVIDTGSDIPFLFPSFSADGLSGLATQFKPTGIKMVVTPYVLTPDLIQLDIAVDVAVVSGFVSAGVGDAVVENPLISTRRAYTVVNVPSGKTVLIGGLVATDESEAVDKVPILGDIPLLGYLFKRKVTSQRKVQVLFFVKPKLIRFREEEVFDPLQEND